MSQFEAQNALRVEMSHNLRGSLQRAITYAYEQSHRHVTLEHLLLALSEDREAAVILEASSVDVQALVIDVSDHLGRLNDRVAAGTPTEPMLGSDVQHIIHSAGAAAQKSQRRGISSALVLAAIVGDGRSPAAQLLRNRGLTFEHAVEALKQANNSAAPTSARLQTDSHATLPSPHSSQPATLAPPAPTSASEPRLQNMQAAHEIIASARERIAAARGAAANRQKQHEASETTAADTVPAEIAPLHEQSGHAPAAERPAPVQPLPTASNTAVKSAGLAKLSEADDTGGRPSGQNDAEVVLPAGASANRPSDVPKQSQRKTQSAEPPPFQKPEVEPNLQLGQKPEVAAAPINGPATPPPPRSAPPPIHPLHEPRSPQSLPPVRQASPSQDVPPNVQHRGGFPTVSAPQNGAPPPPGAHRLPTPRPNGAPANTMPPPSEQRDYPQGARQQFGPPAGGSTRQTSRELPGAISRNVGGDLGEQPDRSGRLLNEPVQRPRQPDQIPNQQPNAMHPSRAVRGSQPVGPPVGPQVGFQDRPQYSGQPASPDQLNGSSSPNRAPPRYEAPDPASTVTYAARLSATAKPIEPEKLIEAVPTRMCLGVPTTVEIRVPRAQLEAWSGGNHDPRSAAGQVITKAMVMRLKGLDGGFTIEPASPETQWSEGNLGPLNDEDVSWRWMVTPTLRGRHALQLHASARVVGRDGLSAARSLPEQVVEVRVSSNYARLASRLAICLAFAVAGIALGYFGEGLFSMGGSMLAQVMR